MNDRKIYKPELNKYLLSENIIDISCGAYHTLILTSNGEVYTWGNKSNDWCVLIPFKLNAFNGKKENQFHVVDGIQ